MSTSPYIPGAVRASNTERERGRFLQIAEVHERWPEALVAFDWQCPHLQADPSLRFHTIKGRLRAYTGDDHRHADYGYSPSGRAYWHDKFGVWSRCTVNVSSGGFPERSREPDLRPFTLEYVQAPWRLSDYVKIRSTVHGTTLAPGPFGPPHKNHPVALMGYSIPQADHCPELQAFDSDERRAIRNAVMAGVQNGTISRIHDGPATVVSADEP